MYYINYHTGAGNTTADTIEEAKRIADDGACYTQQDITIEDESGNILLQRGWCGIAFNPNNYDAEDLNPDDILIFGTFGFYDNWRADNF